MSDTMDNEAKALEKSINDLLAKVETFQIFDEDDYQLAAEFLRDSIKRNEKRVVETFDEERKERYEAYKEVTDRIKWFNDHLNRAETHLKKEMLRYYTERQREARAEFLKAQRAAEEERLSAAADTGDEQSLEEAYIPEPKEPVTKIDGISYIETWTYRIHSPESLPRKFLKADDAKIKKTVQAMKADSDIPGVEVYSTSQIRVKA